MLRQELAEADRDKAMFVPSSWSQRLPLRRCVICDRIESELFDFFCRRQYELSANEDDRHEHAMHLSFCPTHTWQYANIASPQGISVGYAPLLSYVARQMRDVACTADSVDSIRENIRGLQPSMKNCPACRKRSEVEEIAVEEFRQTLEHRNDTESDAGLCLLYLGTVLDRETDVEKARNLVLEQVDAMGRTVENMQAYSLKHDALCMVC